MAGRGDSRMLVTRGKSGARHTRVKAIAFMTVALLGAVLAAWLISRLVRRRGAGNGTPLVKVAVAAVDLAASTKLTAGDYRWADWPAASVPAGSFLVGKDPDGYVTRTALVKGEPLIASRLGPPGTGAGMAAMIPPNMRAMTVKVNDVSGVGGFIHPGDIVDVLTTMQMTAPSGSEQEFHSKIVLQGVKVLAVGEQMATTSEARVKATFATLLVTPAQSESLTLAATHGELQLTLRSQADQGNVPTPGIAPPELLGTSSRGAGAARSIDQAPVARAGREHRTKRRAPPQTIEILRGNKREVQRLPDLPGAD